MGAIKTFLRSLTDEQLQRVIDSPQMSAMQNPVILYAITSPRGTGCLVETSFGCSYTDALSACSSADVLARIYAAHAYDALTLPPPFTRARNWTFNRATRVIQEAALRVQAQRQPVKIGYASRVTQNAE